MYELRPYQRDAVEATLKHFRQGSNPAVLVLPTGAGKSLVIAELARLARGRVLVLAHVKELVEQNHAKYLSSGFGAGIFSAGLGRKDNSAKVIFGSVQSVARAPTEFFVGFSLLIIDECHRVESNFETGSQSETQYHRVIGALKRAGENLKILGLTATPYRLGAGWIYQFHRPRKLIRTLAPRFFKTCIFELSLKQMIDGGYLTPPIRIDSPVACYDFSRLELKGAVFAMADLEKVLNDQRRVTPVIVQNVIDMSAERAGVMIFTSSVRHAGEILRLLPPFVSALIVGESDARDRAETITAFKERRLKYLVNVSVLTTGFDAPHVDVIALLRPTESASLYQQIVGRGLRLSPGKQDCLILDYTGQDHDINSPMIDEPRPPEARTLVDVECPECGTINKFWGIQDENGFVEEHFGRRCRGAVEDPRTLEPMPCGYLFRFKRCDQCGAENDISAHVCAACEHVLRDADKKLREAMALKDAHILRVDSMSFDHTFDKKGVDRLQVDYFDADANSLREYFYLDSRTGRQAFYLTFARMHLRVPELNLDLHTVEDVLKKRKKFRAPAFVIARKLKKFWKIREKIFRDEISLRTLGGEHFVDGADQGGIERTVSPD